LRLLRRHPFRPDDVESISCDLKPYPLVRERPKRGVEGRFSMPFCLALSVVHGTIRPNDFTDENVLDPVVQDLMRRTRQGASGTLVVQLKNGQRLEEPVERPTNLVERSAIEKKFYDCVAGALPKDQAQAVAEAVDKLEQLPSIRQLTRNLRSGD
jgi:2-methylcitrate dehydratase PrpD